MRLRNRQINAEYWTDPYLLRQPREKRFTYLGLAAVCEDSGCVEDDPFTMKLVLWPSPVDADITEAIIGEWVDEWVGLKKLVRYASGDSTYLFMVNFPEYQKPRNPQSPNLPLPEWVTWVPNESDARKGKYEYRADLLESCTSVVRAPYNACPPRGGLALSGLALPGVDGGTTVKPSSRYAPPLPQCLDTDAGYRDELKGFTYAQVIMHDAEAKFAPWSGLDQSAFRAIFHRTCFRDCSCSPRQVEHCADVTLKAIEKANDSWPASKSLVTRILEQDRRDVEVAS